MKHKALIICIAVLSILLAIGITIYPLVSSAYNEQHQSQIHVSYQEKIKKQIPLLWTKPEKEPSPTIRH